MWTTALLTSIARSEELIFLQQQWNVGYCFSRFTCVWMGGECAPSILLGFGFVVFFFHAGNGISLTVPSSGCQRSGSGRSGRSCSRRRGGAAVPARTARCRRPLPKAAAQGRPRWQRPELRHPSGRGQPREPAGTRDAHGTRDREWYGWWWWLRE